MTEYDPLEALGAYDKLVAQGAEGRVFEVLYLKKPTIVKQRFKKKYRHPELDAKLTKQRFTSEARSLLKARKLGIHVPAIYFTDAQNFCIYMEKIQGQSVKAALFNGDLTPEKATTVATQIGKTVAKLHDGGLIHGDLTTSNMMLKEGSGELALIDFGLSFNSILTEDKGVDLYVLERAFLSAHSASGNLFESVLDGYRKNSKNWSSVYNRFATVRARGRKRTMVG
ncbi:hypothetical protein CYMTET_35414 [Cymbomonas tetramitiformis]|uniref:non-specific serine/threonine protein kinase n=1 Tax=Cymbomonas tetramitiformis TaxID=36881 RepID=A0AAE0F978_9CHLO|nr:hypothetical protein CYMTET_35414 [Cymbomonas tetramitiformis]|eukprot:gene8678-10297_t